MADYDLKSITPDTSFVDGNFLFGADDQSSGTPKPYSSAGLKSWIDTTHPTISNNLSDINNAETAIINLGASPKIFKTYVAGRYYVPPGLIAGSSAAVAAANRVYFSPFFVPQKITISELFVRVGTGSAGNWQGAVYASHATTCMPTGSELAKSGASASTSGSSAPVSTTLASNVQLSPGTLYWMGFNTDTATPTFGTLNAPGDAYSAASLIGDTTMSNVMNGGASILRGFHVASITLGTWGDMTSASFTAVTTAIVPLLGFKVASVP